MNFRGSNESELLVHQIFRTKSARWDSLLWSRYAIYESRMFYFKSYLTPDPDYLTLLYSVYGALNEAKYNYHVAYLLDHGYYIIRYQICSNSG